MSFVCFWMDGSRMGQDMDDIEATRLLQEEMKFQDEQRSRGLPPLPPCPASPLELSPEEVEAEALLQVNGAAKFD